MNAPISVLIVEDHNLFRAGIRVGCQRDKSIVISGEATNGEEAVVKAAALNPDVILMDIRMPLMDGFESSKVIKAKNGKTKIIMLSSHDSEDVIASAMSSGASGYCHKDIDSELLCSAIKAVHKGELWFDAGARKNSAISDSTVPSHDLQTFTRPQSLDGLRQSVGTSSRNGQFSFENFESVPRTSLSDKFENLGLLGQGGMSQVYKARHKVMDRLVAIKFLSAQLGPFSTFAARFAQEARICSNLSHPNIVSIYDFGVTTDGEAYLVMEYAEGPTLAETLKKSGRMEEKQCWKLFEQLKMALSYAHSKNVVHRDIKPANVILQDNGDNGPGVKLVDFGLAKVVSEKHPSLTLNGEIMGSPIYMSPEQCQGLVLDQRSDIYSLGCLIYEALCGYPPFRGKDALETIRMHVQEIPAAPPKHFCSEQMRKVLKRCLQKQPEHRYSDVREIELPRPEQMS